MRSGRLVAPLVAALALGGCYGTTEPATDVAFDRATLNGRGTADDGPAYSYFEYWPTSSPAAVERTFDRRWPAGASGAINERTNPFFRPLYASTAYSFRLCGGDEGEPARCAQTRTFATPAPPGDAAIGSWAAGTGRSGSVDAAAGPTGQNPRGTVTVSAWNSSGENFSGRVTCLRVSGARAVVGAVGQSIYPPTGVTRPVTAVATVLDGGIGGQDEYGHSISTGSTAPSCVQGPSSSPPSVGASLNVYDAP